MALGAGRGSARRRVRVRARRWPRRCSSDTPHSGLNAADELKAQNDVRTTLVQALAGLAVAGGLVVTYRTYRQNRASKTAP